MRKILENCLQITKRVHAWACNYEGLLLLLTLLLFLRLPNLTEPYWYGDEAIYLSIGVALRNGSILYQNIVDHKTPLIYFFAMFPGQVWFRIFTIFWMAASTSFFYWISCRLLKKPAAFISSVVFVLLTSLPWLEGNIPNGELFVMGFILASLWLLSHTSLWDHLTKIRNTNWSWSKKDFMLIFLAGAVAGLGILTKVPAILDFGALGTLFVFTAWAKGTPPKWRPTLRWMMQGGITFVLGMVLPLILSVFYFWMRGAFQDYLQFGLLYNIYYSGNWSLPFAQEWLIWLFSLPGKAVVLGIVLAITMLWIRWKPTQLIGGFIYFWVFAALFAATLSNRPYPHYLLQVIPPLSLAAGVLVAKKQHWFTRILMIDAAAAILFVMVLLDFGLYSSWSYYQRYFQLGTGQITTKEYHESFDWLVAQNSIFAPIIIRNTEPSDRIFVWGTNPMLYAQTQRAPVTRFTVAFHIHDLKQYDQTMNEVRNGQPKFIVVMKSEATLPGLDEYLQHAYIISSETNDMILYRRTSLNSLDLLQ